MMQKGDAFPERGVGGRRNKAALSVRGLTFSYPGCGDALVDVDFDLGKGELATLLGPNGAGKSTLLNCIMNLLVPQKGEVLVLGMPVRETSSRDLAQSVAYVPQTTDVNFAYTVVDYVAMGRAPYLRMCESPGIEDVELCHEALSRLGIEKLAARAYNELSGGQRQLANVARAIVQSPDILLFDEPTSALDYGNQVKVLELIADLAHDGYSIIMTTYNPDHPILLGSSVCLLGRDGRLVKGAADEIMREEVIGKVYDAPLIIRDVADAGRRVCMTPAFRVRVR